MRNIIFLNDGDKNCLPPAIFEGRLKREVISDKQIKIADPSVSRDLSRLLHFIFYPMKKMAKIKTPTISEQKTFHARVKVRMKMRLKLRFHRVRVFTYTVAGKTIIDPNTQLKHLTRKCEDKCGLLYI